MTLKIIGFVVFVLAGALFLFWPEIKTLVRSTAPVPEVAAPTLTPMEARIQELKAQGYKEIGTFAVKPDGSFGEFTPSPEEAARRAKQASEE